MISRRMNLSILTVLLVLGLFLSNSQATSQATTQNSQPAQGAVIAGHTIYFPIVRAIDNLAAAEWTQHGHDAMRTSFTTQTVAAPWRWKWAWNGPTAQGGVISGKIRLPRNSQPVTGGGRVYIAAGVQGVYALNQTNGIQVWHQNPGGEIDSTLAYDADSDALFVVSSNGRLYRLNAANGLTTGEFIGQATSTLPLPPALYGDRVYFSMGNFIYAIQKISMGVAWSYNAGSALNTPPAFSPASGLIVAASEDLFVHAVHDANGLRAWRVKPTSLAPGDPGDTLPNAEVKYGWPVIAEVHGLVLVKLRLNWQTLWTWSPWPTTNAQMRANLAGLPSQQALYALRLSDGGVAFNTNVGHGGFGDGGRMPMGPQPVVKRFSDGSEVAYVVMRGSPCLKDPCDGRYDSRFGEMPLDATTVPGFQAGDVRFMQNTHFPTDEQPNLSMSGDDIFGGHWMFGLAHQILNRSASRGATSGTPITTSNLPHIVTSASNCAFSASHYCANGLIQDGDARNFPAGFYIYYNQGTVYGQYWSGYAAWVVSGNTVYYVSTDGAVVALENGSPTLDPMVSVMEPEITPEAVVAQPIAYTRASEFAGSIADVEGEIKFKFNNGKDVLLGFENPHVNYFKALIPVESWKNFPVLPELLYGTGQSVRVHGKIEWYQGDPVIYVRSPEQIEILK